MTLDMLFAEYESNSMSYLLDKTPHNPPAHQDT